MAQKLAIENDCLSWQFLCEGDRLKSLGFHNKLTDHAFELSSIQEIGLVFSANADRLEQPYANVDDFELRDTKIVNPSYVIFHLQSRSANIPVTVHYQLDGNTRRKWVEIKNQGKDDLLLLDIELEDFSIEASTSGGGHGQPIFIANEVFSAIEHPAGMNQNDDGHIHITHFPGKRLSAGESFRSHTALVSVAKENQALEHFISYIQERPLYSR